jgi:ABC-type multidrug transport system fused ATPase/permease subunit
MSIVLQNIGWAAAFCVLGAVLGMVLIVMATAILPGIIARFTPNLDEEKEIARGNQAVAEYFGRVVAAAILGISIVVAAAILGGILAGLHG